MLTLKVSKLRPIMSQVKKGFLILLLLVSAMRAEAQTSCKELEAACIDVIQAADNAIKQKNAEIDLQRSLIEKQDEKIAILESQKNDPIKSGLTGALIGIIIFSIVQGQYGK